jgi:hypothetical protein
MAGDSWGQAKAVVISLWRRVHPSGAEGIEAALDSTRAKLCNANLEDIFADFKLQWEDLLETLARDNLALVGEIASLAGELESLAGQHGEPPVSQHVSAGRDAYTAGRDQHLNIGSTI